MRWVVPHLRRSTLWTGRTGARVPDMRNDPLHEYIVITANCTISSTDYAWDGQRWPTFERAVEHGFTLDRCDDFNIGLIHGDRLLWFGWMDKPINQDREKVADALGFRSRALMESEQR